MRINHMTFWIFLILTVLYVLPIQAVEWQLVAEYPGREGWINQLVIHPDKPDVFFAATEGAGVLLSEDAGKTWTPKNQGLTQAAEGTVSGLHVRCLALDPNEEGTMYAGMAAFGVFKTTDGGTSWSTMNEMLGDTFTKVMAIHPDKPDTLYLGTDGGGIYRYKFDSEEPKWEEIIEGMKNTYVKTMVMIPDNLDVIYAGTDGGISMTNNGGDSWINMTSGPRYVLALAVNPENPKIIYAGSDGSGLMKSVDGGDSWVAVGGDIWLTKGMADEFAAPGEDSMTTPMVSSIAINPVNTSIVYAGNPSGFFRSTDAGETWTQENTGLSNINVKCIKVSQNKPVTVYTGTSGAKLFSYVEE
ncbi:hypothetical protein GF312_18050 [Candidatus Poribacteria bacterium]|nr:hypothetical protein [Candidatus Poribacteria bacterium]